MALPKRKPQSDNRERILETAIALMNEQGGAVGTSQIANHLGISPGNLYYHFRNREAIMRELFLRLSEELTQVLRTKEEDAITADYLASCFTGGARVLWRYRFFFAVDFIRRDEALAESYRALSHKCKAYMQIIIRGALRRAPGHCSATPNECERLAENMWVLWISWPRYTEIDGNHSTVREIDIWRGLEQIAFLLSPYLEEGYFAQIARRIRAHA
ncbi:MAG: TetR/AcrR family transcriptional regulator [Algiphilus sp.]